MALQLGKCIARIWAISIKGRQGHNVAIDEYVDTAKVRLLKVCSKKHNRLYAWKDQYEYMDGSTPSSVPDKFLIVWFIVKGFFMVHANHQKKYDFFLTTRKTNLHSSKKFQVNV